MDADTTSKCSALVEDMIRHERDYRLGLWEGLGEEYRELVYRNSFTLATPTALECLNNINRTLFDGNGTVRAVEPHDDGRGGLIGTWELTWPELEASVVLDSEQPYPPVRVAAVLAKTGRRGHLVLLHPLDIQNDEGSIKALGPRVQCAWPFQVTSEEDAAHLEPLIYTLIIGQIHDTTVRSSMHWNVLPAYETPASYGHASTEPVTAL